jgi:hypothetical protein
MFDSKKRFCIILATKIDQQFEGEIAKNVPGTDWKKFNFYALQNFFFLSSKVISTAA